MLPGQILRKGVWWLTMERSEEEIRRNQQKGRQERLKRRSPGSSVGSGPIAWRWPLWLQGLLFERQSRNPSFPTVFETPTHVSSPCLLSLSSHKIQIQQDRGVGTASRGACYPSIWHTVRFHLNALLSRRDITLRPGHRGHDIQSSYAFLIVPSNQTLC